MEADPQPQQEEAKPNQPESNSRFIQNNIKKDNLARKNLDLNAKMNISTILMLLTKRLSFLLFPKNQKSCPNQTSK